MNPHKDDGMHNSADIRKRFGSVGKEIPVLYEDDSILVIDKPSGLVVQPGNESQLGSLLDLLEYYRLEHSAENRTTFRHTPVHRLDRGTSGVLIVAKTRQEARILSREFAAGTIEKIYLAVVEGRPAKKTGRIENPLKTSKDKISDTALSESGKRAVTDFRVLREMSKGRSLLEIRIGPVYFGDHISVPLGFFLDNECRRENAGHGVCGASSFNRFSPAGTNSS